MQATTYSRDEIQKYFQQVDSKIGLHNADKNPLITSRSLWEARKNFMNREIEPDIITPNIDNYIIIDDIFKE